MGERKLPPSFSCRRFRTFHISRWEPICSPQRFGRILMAPSRGFRCSRISGGLETYESRGWKAAAFASRQCILASKVKYTRVPQLDWLALH